jgi:hypothetical protein
LIYWLNLRNLAHTGKNRMSDRFDSLWIDELAPWLAQREAEYKVMVARGRKFALIAFGLSIVIVLLTTLIAALPLPLILGGLAASVGVTVLAWAAGSSGVSELSAQIKNEVLDRVADTFDLKYAAQPANPARFNRFQELGILPSDSRRSFGDHFSGHSHGTDYEFYEAHLEQRHTRTVVTKNGTRTEVYYVTVFHGALIRINFPRKVEGITVVTRDAGWFNGLSSGQRIDGRKLERIGLVDLEFEDVFEVYGDDQVLARYMLTPSFMERLLALETAMAGTGLTAAFDANSGDGELLIATHTGNQFETAGTLNPIPDRETIERIINEIRLITQIVDMVVKPAEFGGHEAS